MLGLAILFAGAVFGVGAVRRIGWPLGRTEQLALIAAFALTATPWAIFLGAWSLGFAAGLPVAVVFLAGSGILLGRGHRLAIASTLPPSRLSWLFLAILFALLFHGHMLHAESTGLWTGGSTYGDLALHTTLASRFSSAEIDLSSPIASGEVLTYPFLGDLLVAALVRGGWSMSTAFAITGWLSAMTGLALIDALARRMFQRRAAGTIAVWLVVLSGALVGLWYAAVDVSARGLPSEPGALPSYANMWQRGVTWSNFVCDFLLPQRALLAAFPAVWAAALMLRIAADETGRGDRMRSRALVVAGALIGALPFLHVHTFLIAMGMLFLVAATLGVKDGARHVPWLALVLALALASPQLWWQLGQSWDSRFGQWQPGWRAPRGEFWWYWLRNWGLPLALLPLAAWHAITSWRRTHTIFPVLLLAGALATFVAANLYQFQPHDWDNMKLFVYVHMAVAIVLAGALARALDAGRVARVLAGLAIAGMTATGALTLVRELDKHDQLATTDDLRLARRLREVLPPDARVLTADQHNHVVPMLAGRRIVMGYRGWLWSHGVDIVRLERDVRAMYSGGRLAPAVMRRRGVTHVYIGPGERRDWSPDEAWFRARYPSVLSVDGVEVFDVRHMLPPRLSRLQVKP